jgi:hypothetical protein
MAESAGNASEAMPAPSGLAEHLPGSLSHEFGLRQLVLASCARCLARAGEMSIVWSACGTAFPLNGGSSW